MLAAGELQSRTESVAPAGESRQPGDANTVVLMPCLRRVLECKPDAQCGPCVALGRPQTCQRR